MELLYRKYVAASISGVIYSLILAISYSKLIHGHFYEHKLTVYAISMLIYMLYVLGACYTYGVITSIISEKIGFFLARKSNDHRLLHLVSLSLHLVFGLVLLWFSLPAAVLFFLIDLLLRRRSKPYTLHHALISIGAVIVIWLLLLAVQYFYS